MCFHDFQDERVYDLGRSDGSGLRVEVSGTDWTNIIIPGSSGAISGISGGQFHHEKQFTLTDLVPDAQYECLVQAKNKYGWSEASRIHNFYTHSSLYGELGLIFSLTPFNDSSRF